MHGRAWCLCGCLEWAEIVPTEAEAILASCCMRHWMCCGEKRDKIRALIERKDNAVSEEIINAET